MEILSNLSGMETEIMEALCGQSVETIRAWISHKDGLFGAARATQIACFERLCEGIYEGINLAEALDPEDERGTIEQHCSSAVDIIRDWFCGDADYERLLFTEPVFMECIIGVFGKIVGIVAGAAKTREICYLG
jgi:hypothetical protein